MQHIAIAEAVDCRKIAAPAGPAYQSRPAPYLKSLREKAAGKF